MALMPEVAFLTTDPDLGAQSFAVTRKTITWQGGRPVENGEPETITAVGIIVPPSQEQLEFFPEGEKTVDRKAIYTKEMLHVTQEGSGNVSDTIFWRGGVYRIVGVDRYDDWGFCVAYATKG